MRTLDVQEPWLEQIRLGRKTTEGRVGHLGKFDDDVIFQQKSLTPQLLLTSEKQQIPVFLLSVFHYQNLQSYLDGEGWQNVAPHCSSREETEEAYLNITMKENGEVVFVFSPERIARLGGINALRIGVS